MKKKTDETVETSAKTEEQDHADNEASAEKPIVIEPRRDGNGALIT